MESVVILLTGGDRVELTWMMGSGISECLHCQLLPPLRDTQFLPLPSAQGKRRTGMNYSCSLLSVALLSNHPEEYCRGFSHFVLPL